MTTIAIVGSGRAATLHAEAARAAGGIELVGVGGRRDGSARALAAAMGVEELTLDQLVRRADALVIAVSPAAVGEVLSGVPPAMPVLVESPVGIADGAPPARPVAMAAVNLLHATATRRALAALGRTGPVHHLTLRMRTPRPDWGEHGTSRYGGVVLDPGAGLVPVLLAAAAEPVVEVEARMDDPTLPASAVLGLVTASGRRITASMQWADGGSTADLEAAAADRVVALALWPTPVLEIDGRRVEIPSEPPLSALGFVAQINRFAAVARGEAAPWPSLDVGHAVLRIAAAAREAARSGAVVSVAGADQ